MVEKRKPAQARTVAMAAAMEAVVAAMDPVTRDIFVRHRVDGWSNPRIAEVRGISVAEVERHIASAISAFDLGLSRLGL